MDDLIAQAFTQGGMALAFVIMLWAYRELWSRRVDELKVAAAQRAEEIKARADEKSIELRAQMDAKDADRKVLLETVQNDSALKERLVATLDAIQTESRASRVQMEAKTTQILQEMI